MNPIRAIWNPSLVRRALDELLAMHPHMDVVSIEWQIETSLPATEHERRAPSRVRPLVHAGPWVLVQLGQPSESFDEVPAWAIWRYAIWKSTGAVHAIDGEGAVSDDPILTVEPPPEEQP